MPQANTTLVSLGLGYNELGPSGGAQLAAGLHHVRLRPIAVLCRLQADTALAALDVSGNEFGAEACALIVEALRVHLLRSCLATVVIL